MLDIPKRQPQSKEEYIEEICFKNSISITDFYNAFSGVEKCECGYSGCTGWLVINRKSGEKRII